MPTDLHFIARVEEQGEDRWHQIDKVTFETGHWEKITDQLADEIVKSCGRVFLHNEQRGLAWHGGRIVDWRPGHSGRKIFKYIYDKAIHTLAPPKNWGRELAIVHYGSPRQRSRGH